MMVNKLVSGMLEHQKQTISEISPTTAKTSINCVFGYAQTQLMRLSKPVRKSPYLIIIKSKTHSQNNK
ncbi:hypothetical protein COR50_20755 [Chitinophaga caeni]|uniref:Uncharacterized protein n=1 Tax=Chitinophaga caeni TaxID=2029983 RepID=A0A291QZU5_9BACT|nr:hypothetical protein COR50_20755 [Chitinophaga caeni]